MSQSDGKPRPGDEIVEPLYAGLASPESEAPFLVHDGDCPWCRFYVGRLITKGHLPAHQSRTWQELEGKEREMVWEAGIAKGMVAFEPSTGVSRLGEKALLWVLETPGPLRFPFRAMRWPGMGPVMAWAYRTVVWLRKKRFPNMPCKP
ncbi:MAG: hypothetical protein P1V35_04270 [Planctomycetota bacterium]|nr:hypothetical protein [Planctomycetota bacterium]